MMCPNDINTNNHMFFKGTTVLLSLYAIRYEIRAASVSNTPVQFVDPEELNFNFSTYSCHTHNTSSARTQHNNTPSMPASRGTSSSGALAVGNAGCEQQAAPDPTVNVGSIFIESARFSGFFFPYLARVVEKNRPGSSHHISFSTLQGEGILIPI